MALLWLVEHFLRVSGMCAATFGRRVLNDPALVRDMRRGREPRAATEARIRAFIAEAGR